MNKVFTLGNLLDSINNSGNDVDVYVDGIDGIAVCSPVKLTDEGRKHFEAALSLPVKGYWVMGEDKDMDDLYEYEEEGKGNGGRLVLAWELIKSLAGYCPISNFERWFER